MSRYVLTLEAKHQADDPKGVRRLRMLLKTLLRAWGFRCVAVVPEDAGEAKPEPMEGNEQ